MKYQTKILSILLFFSVINGCSWFGDDDGEFEPTPLVDIEPQLELKKLWQVDVGDGVGELFTRLGPVYGYDKIFAADAEGKVFAFDAGTGEQVWQHDSAAQLAGGVAVGSEHVALGTYNGEVIVLNAEDGTEVWRNTVSSEVIAKPAIGEGNVVVRTGDGKLVAFDLESGERRWFYDRQVPVLTLRGTSAPVISRGAAISGFDNGKVGVFLLDNGQLAWEKRVATPSGRSELERIIDVDTTPMIFGTTLYVAAYNGNVSAIELRNGEVIWQRQISSFHNLGIDSQLIYVTHTDGEVSALDRSNGTIYWTQKLLQRRNLTAPVEYKDDVVVGDFEGYLHLLSRNDGSFIARTQLDGSGFAADPIVAEDKLFALSRDGTLAAFEKP